MARSVVEISFHSRYAETDQMGIIHHSAYIVWLEEGRSYWFRAHGRSYIKFEADGLALPVSEIHVRYKQPARYDRRVTVQCWVEDIRSRQVQFNYKVIDAETGTVFLSGYTKHICIDRAGHVAMIPEQWLQFLAQE